VNPEGMRGDHFRNPFSFKEVQRVWGPPNPFWKKVKITKPALHNIGLEQKKIHLLILVKRRAINNALELIHQSDQ
jgi:hypothetical protein